MKQRVEQHRRVAAGEHEAVPVGPVRDRADCGGGSGSRARRPPGASAIGVPGWPDCASSTASMESARIALMLRQARSEGRTGSRVETTVSARSSWARMLSAVRPGLLSGRRTRRGRNWGKDNTEDRQETGLADAPAEARPTSDRPSDLSRPTTPPADPTRSDHVDLWSRTLVPYIRSAVGAAHPVPRLR